MAVRPDGSRPCATSIEVGADDPAGLEQADDLHQLRGGDAARLGRAGPRRLGWIEHVDVDRHVERVRPELGQQAPDRLHRVHRWAGKRCGAFRWYSSRAPVRMPTWKTRSGATDVHHAGHGRGVVVPLAQELLPEVRVGVELEDAQLRDGRRQDLDDRQRGGVVAAQHDRPRPGRQNRRISSRARASCSRGRAVAQLAVAQVGDGQVFEVAAEERRVGLDGVGGQPELAGAVVGAAAEVDAAFEGDAEEDDPGRPAREARQAMKRGSAGINSRR